MATRSIRALLAVAILPLALLACTDDGGDDAVPGSTTSEAGAASTTMGEAAPESDLPDICTIVDAARVEEIMGGTVAETFPATHEGGGASCAWTIEGTTHALRAVVYPTGTDTPAVAFPEGVFGGNNAQVTTENRPTWSAESSVTFSSDPGRDMTPILTELNEDVLDAAGG